MSEADGRIPWADTDHRNPASAVRDGEGLVTEETVARAGRAYFGDDQWPIAFSRWPDRQRWERTIRRVLAAVAPDIAAAAVREALAPLVDGTGREGPEDADDPAGLLAREVRRQCAEQVRVVATSVRATCTTSRCPRP